MENVVLRLDDDVACVAAVCCAILVGREGVGRGVIVECRMSPSAGVWKPPAILLDEKDILQNVRHIHGKKGLRALFESLLKLGDLGAIGKRPAIAGNAAL